MTTLTLAAAQDLITHEGWLLDEGCRDPGKWRQWLDLYLPDASFHVPAWRDEVHPTEDPARELSLIWYQGRRNLEDRVWRATSGLSVASSPPPRVAHLIGSVRVADPAEGIVTSAFAVHRFDRRSDATHAFFGHYRHRLVHDGADWRIAAKTVLLMNDTIPTVLDFFHI